MLKLVIAGVEWFIYLKHLVCPISAKLIFVKDNNICRFLQTRTFENKIP
jgi:hypothetical protein